MKSHPMTIKEAAKALGKAIKDFNHQYPEIYSRTINNPKATFIASNFHDYSGFATKKEEFILNVIKFAKL